LDGARFSPGAKRRFEPSGLGAGPGAAYEPLLPLLHIGEEGARIFDMEASIESGAEA